MYTDSEDHHLQFKFNAQATKSCEKMPWTYKDTGVAPGEIFFMSGLQYCR